MPCSPRDIHPMETPLPDPIRNRVDESGLIALDLDQLAPKANVRSLDLSAYLEKGLILREKPFRAAMAELNAADWDGSTVALNCASDAILPDWAWMLATSKLTALGARVASGTKTVPVNASCSRPSRSWTSNPTATDGWSSKDARRAPQQRAWRV